MKARRSTSWTFLRRHDFKVGAGRLFRTTIDSKQDGLHCHHIERTNFMRLFFVHAESNVLMSGAGGVQHVDVVDSATFSSNACAATQHRDLL